MKDETPWLSVHPLDGKLALGAELELCLVAHVEGGFASSAEYLSFNTMDTILILSTEGHPPDQNRRGFFCTSAPRRGGAAEV